VLGDADEVGLAGDGTMRRIECIGDPGAEDDLPVAVGTISWKKAQRLSWAGVIAKIPPNGAVDVRWLIRV